MQCLFNYVPENVLILKYQKVKKKLLAKCYLDALDTVLKNSGKIIHTLLSTKPVGPIPKRNTNYKQLFYFNLCLAHQHCEEMDYPR
jgi:hypothetical protein